MTKIRTILKSSKGPDDRRAVLLMLSDRGKREYFSTGFTATLKEFDDSKDVGRFVQGRGVRSFKVLRKEEDGSIKEYSNSEANAVLSKLEERAGEILRGYNQNHTNWGLEQFRADFINAPKRELFYTYALNVIEQEYTNRGKFKTATVAKEALQSLLNYDSQLKNKTFQDINVRYLKAYCDSCREKGNSEVTLKIRLGAIRRIYNIAIREKVATQELYPFSSGKEDGKVKIPKTPPNRADLYLPLSSMIIMENTVCKNFVLERTRHLYILSYRCRGMNWKDMALLTKNSFYTRPVYNEKTKKTEQKTVMEYRRSKTKGEFEIEVTPFIKKELDWFRDNTPLYKNYVLPIIRVDVPSEKLDAYIGQVRKRCNVSLRKLVKELKLPESDQRITFYTARHSFAMTMQNLGKPVEIISQALGHQSVVTTKHYLAKFSTTRMAEETDIDLSMPVKKKRATKKKADEKPAKPTKQKETKKAPAQ